MNPEFVEYLGDGWFRVRVGGVTQELRGRAVRYESYLEDTIESSPMLLGAPLLILWRQFHSQRSCIDLLAIDATGRLHIIELKRNHTTPYVVAQMTAYESRVANMTMEALIERFAEERPGESLRRAFKDYFGISLPDRIPRRPAITIIANSFHLGLGDSVASMRSHDYDVRLLRYDLLREAGTIVVRREHDESGNPEPSRAATKGLREPIHAPFRPHLRTPGLLPLAREPYVDDHLTPFWKKYAKTFERDCDILPSGFLIGLYKYWLRADPASGGPSAQLPLAVLGGRLAKVVKASGAWVHHRRRIGTTPLPSMELRRQADWALPAPHESICCYVKKELF